VNNRAKIILCVVIAHFLQFFAHDGFLLPNVDVLQGRGSATNNHIGNIRFREMVKKYQDRYSSACKSDKPLVALEIVLVWKRQSPPGRFLAYHNGKVDSDECSKSECWYEISEQVATRKVAQRLREKNTSFHLSQLRRQQKHAMKDLLLTNKGGDSQRLTTNSNDEEELNPLSELANFFASSSSKDVNNNDRKISSSANSNSTKMFGALNTMLLPNVSKSEQEDCFLGMLEPEEHDLETDGFIAMSIPTAADLLNVFE
jgi:hypothetical protein